MNKSIDKLLDDRYYDIGEVSWEQLSGRVSSIYPEIFEDMLNKKFIASSPTLMNCNAKGREGTLSSCFTMNIYDSIEDIYRAVLETALVTKSSGGVGYNFTELRSSLEGVKSLGGRKSSGVLSFISNFNSVLETIQQGGSRRGAGMAMLSIYHPDILHFITAKQSQDIFHRFNFSVRIPNKFYKKLKEDPNSAHMIKFIDGTELSLKNEKNKEVTTRELWNIIVKYAREYGEPGIFNEDIAFERCTLTHLNKNVLSNPCFTGDTLILVAGEKEPITIKKLADKDRGFLTYSAKRYENRPSKKYSIWKEEIKEATAFKTGTKDVYKVTLNNGDIFKSTKDHLLALFNEEDYVKVSDSPNIPLSPIFTFGISNKKHININSFTNVNSKQHKQIWEYYNGPLPKGKVIHHTSYESDLLENLECMTKKEHDLILKESQKGEGNTVHKMDKEYQSYLGKKNHTGFKNGNSSGITNLEIIELAKKLVIENKEISIENLVTIDNRVPKAWGKYRFNGDINILKNIVENNFLYEESKFEGEEVLNPNIEEIDYSFYDKNVYVTNIEYIGKEDVYDLTVKDNHNFYIMTGKNDRKDYRGILVHNCQEFFSIPYNACNLGSIDLAKFAKNGKFDWVEFEKVIIRSTNFLNKVIDNNTFPLKKIHTTVKDTRPIGLGAMGLAHLLYKLKIPYNSKKGLKLANDIFSYLTLRSMRHSVDIAIQEHSYCDNQRPYCGAFPSFDLDTFMDANQRFFTKEKCRNVNLDLLQQDIEQYGCYNSSQTSIAPTGTISIIAETSQGMEPVFALTYQRKVEKNKTSLPNSAKEYDIMIVPDIIFHKYLIDNFNIEDQDKILKYIDNNNGSCQGCDLISEEDQKIFITAGDLNSIEHLDMLEQVSNNTSLSVSKTINLPKNVKVEEVEKAYLEAHKRGIIGVTVYRDGSKEGILVHDSNVIKEREAPKRPKILSGHVYRLMVNKEKWIVFIGMFEGVPYEVFAGKIELVDIPSNITEGEIIKAKKGQYSFSYNGEVLIKDIAKLFESREQESITRLISTALRHGTPIKFINQQLSKSYGTITDFNKAILRAFKRYLKDGEDTGEKCETCGSKLIYMEGCKNCSNPECIVSYCG